MAATIADARAAADSASRAFATWSQTGPTERRRILLRAADLVEEKVSEFVRTMALEVGASELWSRFNVGLTASLLREAASLATQIQGETIPTDKPGTLSMTIRQPVGVILSIAPWNGPVVLAARALAYPLVCGNTVVFRASETSPRTHALLVEILHAAGLPAGALNLITTAPSDAPEVIDELIAHPAIRRINFTGSTRVGRIIAQKAALHLKRCLLELGGKSPLIILKDANLDDAARAAVFGSFLYQGQICMSTERIVVDASIADAVAGKIADRVLALPSGDPAQSPSCVIGPMAFRESGARINALIEDALAKGAKILVGGRADGATMPATVLDHVTAEMSIYDAAMRYQSEGRPAVVFAGKEYGTGSSRDWAAKGTKLLGVRAVIAESFERIHRSNLVGMGVLPLQFLQEGWQKLNLTGEEIVTIRGLTELSPRRQLTVEMYRPSDGRIARFPVRCRIDTPTELEYFKNGGVLNYVLRNLAKTEA